MLSKPYRDEFIYNGIGDVESVYELAIFPKINENFIVVITALEDESEISITSCYDRIARQVYLKHLQGTEINKIIWIERIIKKTSEEAFFEVDLSWDDKSKIFHSPQWQPCAPEIVTSIKTSYEECVA